jgi:hypothetical protein
MRHFVAAIGRAVADGTIARNNHMARAVHGPRTSIGMDASTGANPARLGERQNALDHRTMKAVDVLDGRLKHE